MVENKESADWPQGVRHDPGRKHNTPLKTQKSRDGWRGRKEEEVTKVA